MFFSCLIACSIAGHRYDAKSTVRFFKTQIRRAVSISEFWVLWIFSLKMMKLKAGWDRRVDPKRTLASQASVVTGCKFHSVRSDSVHIYHTYSTQPQLSVPTPASVAEFGHTPADESPPEFTTSWPSVLPRSHVLCASSIYFSTLLKGFHRISFLIKPFSSRASWWTGFLLLWANEASRGDYPGVPTSRTPIPLAYLPECSAFSPVTVSDGQPSTWCWIPFPISTHTAVTGLPLLCWARHCEEENQTRALAS